MQIAKEYNINDVAVILSKFHMRPDTNRCIIYPFDVEEFGTWRSVSLPQGVALSLLDGKRTLGDAAKAFSFLFDTEAERGEEIFKSLIRHSNSEPGREFLGLRCASDDTGSFSTYPVMKFARDLRCDEEVRNLKEDRLSVPISLLFMPTNKCEVNCIYCYSQRRPVPQHDYLPLERWLEIIDEAAVSGIDIINFTGGDPLTYSGIETLFKRMIERGIKFLVPTKTFVSEERAAIFADMGMRDMAVIQVSIDGISSDVDKMLESPGYVGRAFSSIKNLVEKGLYVRTNTVCTPINLYEIPELVRKLRVLGVKRANITNYARSYFRHKDALFLNPEQIEWVQEKINKLKTELGWPELRCNMGVRDFSVMPGEDKLRGWKKRSHCSGGKSAMVITADGKVILCEQMPQEGRFIVGNVREQPIAEIWNSPAVKSFVKPPRESFGNTACRDCSEFDECHDTYGRCFRDAFFTYGSLYSPSPNCPHAPKGIRMS
jgi:radical SAM protein with 4Fe4S-binding SPASM domain